MTKESMKKLGIWFLAISLFMAHILFRSALHANEGTTWKQTHTQSGECQIAFPTVPQLVKQSVKLSEEGHRLNYDVYLAPFEDKGVFLLLVATYPMALPSGDEMTGLQGLVKGIVGHSPDNRIVYAKETKEGGCHAPVFHLVGEKKGVYRNRQTFIVL